MNAGGEIVSREALTGAHRSAGRVPPDRPVFGTAVDVRLVNRRGRRLSRVQLRLEVGDAPQRRLPAPLELAGRARSGRVV
jgi:hypothetical protein